MNCPWAIRRIDRFYGRVWRPYTVCHTVWPPYRMAGHTMAIMPLAILWPDANCAIERPIEHTDAILPVCQLHASRAMRYQAEVADLGVLFMRLSTAHCIAQAERVIANR